MPRIAGVPARLFLFDVSILVTLPAVLAAIHFRVPSAFETFAFSHELFRGYTLLTTAYVHASDAHLYSNLLAYALVIGFPYVLGVNTGGRRWFYAVTLAVVLAVPILTSLTDYLVLGLLYPDIEPATFGFSSIVAGFIGVYLVSILRVIADQSTTTLAGLAEIGLSIEVILVAVVRYAPQFIAGFVAVMIVAGVVIIRHSEVGRQVSLTRALTLNRTAVAKLLLMLVLAVTAWVFLLWLVPAPEQIVRSSGVINVIAHVAGLAYGTLIALIGLHIESSYVGAPLS